MTYQDGPELDGSGAICSDGPGAIFQIRARSGKENTSQARPYFGMQAPSPSEPREMQCSARIKKRIITTSTPENGFPVALLLVFSASWPSPGILPLFLLAFCRLVLAAIVAVLRIRLAP